MDGFNTFKVNNRSVAPFSSPYIIAEMACAHNGRYELAQDLVKAAATARVNAIQLQFFVPEHTVTPHHEVFPILQQITFSHSQWTNLFRLGKDLGLDVWACTYDMPSFELANKLGVDGIKINSADLSNPELLKAVASSKIPFSLGTGASTLEEVKAAIRTAETNGTSNFILMHGVQNFPTAIEDLNLARILWLRKEFPNFSIGYADHTSSSDPFCQTVDLIALGMGACLFEKHIVINRAAKGIDYQAALEPHEFRIYAQLLRTAFTALGSSEPGPFTESDLKYRKFQKKSIVAGRELQAGEELRKEDLLFLRNSTPGLPPNELENMLSKRLNKPIAQFQNILTEDLQNEI